MMGLMDVPIPPPIPPLQEKSINSRVKNSCLWLMSIFAGICVGSCAANAAGFAQKLDVQLRADDQTSRHVRYQYRLRYYPQYSFSNTWSINGFAVTGDDYASSHNTVDDGSADYFYARRIYARHQSAYGKTELGIIPTYKDRVSSSGLSKDGWIKGVRHVRGLGAGNFELVFGQLSSLNPADALNTPDELNYVEVEYSVRVDATWSYEVSAERMIDSNFVRTELRYNYSPAISYFGELVSRIDASKTKAVLGVEGELALKHYGMEYFVHYSYVSADFGLRAELTEDFLGTGDGFSAELEGDFTHTKLGWFLRYDAVRSRNRLLGGIKWSL
jgi:hypothetical protein